MRLEGLKIIAVFFVHQLFKHAVIVYFLHLKTMTDSFTITHFKKAIFNSVTVWNNNCTCHFYSLLFIINLNSYSLVVPNRKVTHTKKKKLINCVPWCNIEERAIIQITMFPTTNCSSGLLFKVAHIFVTLIPLFLQPRE